MNEKNRQEKEALLAAIESLIAYGRDEPTINPELLRYFSIEELETIKKRLEARVNTLSDEDKTWLEQFRKEE